jgi:hypothetical protein
VFDQFLQMGRTVDDGIAETLSHRREERVISQICPGNLWGDESHHTSLFMNIQ